MTPKEAVLECLARPAGRVREVVAAGNRPAAAPTPGRSFGGPPWTADLDTVEILKEREILGRHLFVVGFEAEHVRRGPIPMTMLVRAEPRGRSMWVARTMSGASGSGEPPWTEPRVNLGGSWGAHGFCGGGRVHAAGAEVATVCLRFDNGVELADDIRDDWVLFFTDQPVERPDATVELIDPHGEVVGSHAWPWEPDLPETLRAQLRQP